MRPELQLANFNPILSGGQAMGAGIAQAGAAAGGAFKERGDMKKDIAAAQSSAKALLNNPSLDPQLRGVIESTQAQLDDPDLSLRQQHGIATQANQTVNDVLRMGAFQMQKENAAAQQAHRNRGYEMADREFGLKEQAANDEKAYRDSTLGLRKRELDIKEKGPEFSLETDPISGARFVTYGNSMQQVRMPQAELTGFEKNLAAIDRQRVAAGMQPLSDSERINALELYASKQASGSAAENAMQEVMAQLVAQKTGIDYTARPSGQQNLFSAPVPIKPETTAAPVAAPTDAKSDVLKRLGL